MLSDFPIPSTRAPVTLAAMTYPLQPDCTLRKSRDSFMSSPAVVRRAFSVADDQFTGKNSIIDGNGSMIEFGIWLIPLRFRCIPTR